MLLCTHMTWHEKKLYLGGAYRRVLSGHLWEGWSTEVRELIAQLEEQRSRLEDVRERALEEQATARLRQIEQQIDDLRACLE